MILNLNRICSEVSSLVTETGYFIRQQQKKITLSSVETKSKNNFVTFVDKEAEKRLVKGLQKILPGAGFITEEKTVLNSQRQYMWVIDPLDGTTNFIHGVPCYCISIGLFVSSPGFRFDKKESQAKRKGEVVLGVIYEPNLNEFFYGIKNEGAFLNKKKISVTQTKKLKDSLVITGFPTYDYSRMDEYLKLFRYLMEHTHGLRRLGSAAVDLAWVACGRFDCFYEYSLNAWDVAAGSLIVKEAGGKVSDFSGKNNFLFGKEIIASNGRVHAEMINTVKKFF